MAIDSRIVGATTPTLTHDVDARWLMAYAAALGDFNDRYMDTTASPVIAHPVFPVCLEWPVNLERPHSDEAAPPTPEESARVVHAAHDLHLHRPIRAGDRLATRATVIGVRASRVGAVSTTRLDTSDAATGEAVSTSYQTGIYRGVDVTGGDRNLEAAPPLPETGSLDGVESRAIDVPRGLAHLYTECARIWNPIHTDRAVAVAAGLPDIILHGTATLALAVSRIVAEHAGGNPERVKRLGCRFSARVRMPSMLSLACSASDGVIRFEVGTETGDLALAAGFVQLG